MFYVCFIRVSQFYFLYLSLSLSLLVPGEVLKAKNDPKSTASSHEITKNIEVKIFSTTHRKTETRKKRLFMIFFCTQTQYNIVEHFCMLFEVFL
jgi:hypothetical protein